MTVIQEIRKRDGRVVPFHESKIADAINKAFVATYKPGYDETAAGLAHEVASVLEVEGQEIPDVEHIQDIVERVLMDSGYVQTAKAYILYRNERNRVREMNTRLMQIYEDITFSAAKDSDIKRENANIDGDTAMGTMLKYGSEGSKQFYMMRVMKPEHARAHQEGDIHIHDMDFAPMGTTTCTQIDLIRLFHGGFSTGHGTLREPNDIYSYSALACIAIQSNQNDQHGGQSIVNFDYGMAQGVAKTFRRLYRQNLARAVMLLGGVEEDPESEIKAKIAGIEAETGLYPKLEDCQDYFDTERPWIMERFVLGEGLARQCQEFAHKRAVKETDRATYQAMEALIHNLNTMHSRAGAQTPFSSINYGTDTTPEGRMVIRNILMALDAGLGHGETCIFPIHIFKVKEGVNYNEGDPNYDLFRLSCQVSAKRLFPNYVFLDSPYNLQYYKPGHPETEVATMGCRTRVIGNVYDPSQQISYSRGNLSFTSINLPRIAIESHGDEAVFYRKLDEMLELVAQQLMDRFEIQAKKRVYNYPFLMGQGVWLDSDKLGPYDEVREVLKHGTLSIGFIGLAETLTALYGKNHAQDPAIQEKGLAIISHMRQFCDQRSQQVKMNYTLLATPAEGLSGRFTRVDRRRYGKIPGVTDREYYTNSFHVPVWYPIGAFDKIRIEAPYHALCNAGHISYVELDGDTAKNVEAFESVVRCMHDAGIGYGSINHPVDRDPVCGYVGVIGDVCPRCGRREGEAVSQERMEELLKKFPQIKSFIGIE